MRWTPRHRQLSDTRNVQQRADNMRHNEVDRLAKLATTLPLLLYTPTSPSSISMGGTEAPTPAKKWIAALRPYPTHPDCARERATSDVMCNGLGRRDKGVRMRTANNGMGWRPQQQTNETSATAVGLACSREHHHGRHPTVHSGGPLGHMAPSAGTPPPRVVAVAVGQRPLARVPPPPLGENQDQL